MGIRPSDGFMAWLGPLVLIVVFLFIVVGEPQTWQSLCTGDEGEQCLREWVSSLSGWAALVGALLTIGVMKTQLAEQRRQTDYIMGNMPPEMIAESKLRYDGDDCYLMIMVTVTNRNRRPLRLHEIMFEGPDRFTVGIRTSSLGEDAKPGPFNTKFPNTYVHRTIAGKEDGFPSGRCVIECHIFEHNKIERLETNTDRWVEYPAVIRLNVFQKEAKEIPLTLEAFCNFHI